LAHSDQGCLGRSASFRTFVAALAVLFASSVAHANPEGGIVVAGQAAISSSGPNLDVFQASDRAVIDWRSFNIAVHEQTRFYQPSSSSIALNRVNDVNPSFIDGRLSGNGRVVIVNGSGIVFGAGARVDVNGLVATTADIETGSFMAGGGAFNRPGRADARIVNDGAITVAEGGLAALLAPNVENRGVIAARLGRVHLASGDTATVDFYGDGLMEVAVSRQDAARLVRNTGTLSASGGKVALTAAAGRDIVNSLIDVRGRVEANSVAMKDGEIYIYAEGRNAVRGNAAAGKGLKAGGSVVNVDGVLEALGGKISVLGDTVSLLGAANLNASGTGAGGVIRVGGDYYGGGDTPTALNLFVDKNAFIRADAGQNGRGGRITFWSDWMTRFLGSVSARGGNAGGDGGFVEVSGKQYLTFRGAVDTRAPLGVDGLLLLDPADIVIADGTGDGAADGTNTFKGAPSNTVGTVQGADPGPTTIYQSELQGIAATTNIALTATNSITINDLTSNNLNLAQNGGRSVTFTAGAGGFSMNTGDTITLAGGTLNITTSAGGGATIGNINTNGGLTTLNVAGASSVAGIISGTGGLTKTGTGTLTLSGANTYSGTTTLTAGTIEVAHNTALGTGTLSLNGGTLQGNGTSRTLANNITFAATSTISGTSDLTFNGNVTGTTSLTITNNNTGTTTFNGNVTISNSATNRTLTISGTGSTVINGVISNGGTSTASAVTKSGTGTLTLSAANTYAGTTTLSAGTLRATTSASALGAGALSLGGGTLELANDTGLNFGRNTTVTAATTIRSDRLTSGVGVAHTLGTLSQGNTILTINPGVNAASGTADIVFGATTLTNSPTYTVNSGAALTIGTLANGGSNRTITKSGAGMLTLSAAATTWSTTGNALTVNNGTVLLGAANALGSTAATNITVNANAAGLTALFDLNGFNQTIGTLTFGGTGGTSTSTNTVTTGAGVLTLGGNVTLTSTGNPLASTLSGNLDLGGATRTFTVGDSTSATEDLIISAIVSNGGVTKAGTGTMTLSGVNTYSGTTTVSAGTLNLSGGAAILDTGTVTLANTAGVILSLASNEAIGTLTGGGGTGGNITLNGATLTVGDAANITYAGVISGTGGLTKTGSGTMTLSSAHTYTGATTINAGTLTLGAADRLSNSTAVTVAAGATFNLGGFSETIASIVSDGTVTLGSGNTVTTSGAQTYNGAVTGASNTLVSTGGGAITATNVANDFTGNLSVSTTGAISISDANALSLGSVSGGTVLARALGGNLTLTAQVQAAGTSANAIVLTTSSNFINSFGSTALQTGAGGDWKVYSTTPLSDTRGSLAPSFKQYNTAFGGALQGTGNGFVYTVAPTVTVGLTGSVSRTYDGTLAAAISGGNFSVSGGIDGDTISVSNTSGVFDTAHAGVGKTVTVSSLAFSGTNGGVSVYGYQSASPTASGAIGTITPAAITISTGNIIRAYNGTLNANGTATVTVGTLYTNASNSNTQDSLAGGAFAFTNANAGTNKTVTVSGVTVNDGNSGNNYTVTYADNTTSTISKAALSVVANNAEKPYGSNLSFDGDEFSISGTLYGADAVSSVTLASPGALPNALPGGNPYPIMASAASGNGLANYNITYVNGALTVMAAPPPPSASSILPPSVVAALANTAPSFTASLAPLRLATPPALFNISAESLFATGPVSSGRSFSVSDRGAVPERGAVLDRGGNASPAIETSPAAAVSAPVIEGGRSADTSSDKLVAKKEGFFRRVIKKMRTRQSVE